MGLFDRFRKKVKQAEDESSIMVEENTTEAMKAIAERDEALRKMSQMMTETAEAVHVESKWDEFDEEISDPFSTPSSTKDRKRANRAKSSRNYEKATQVPEKLNTMMSTTGRKLAESHISFEIDLSDYQTNIGGMVISGGSVLDEILEDLEVELLSSDMGHDAASELIMSLRRHLIGSRVSRKVPLTKVVEMALKGALLSLLKAGYWDFDRTIREFASGETPVVIMMVGVNGTGKTTTSAKIAKRLDDQGFSVVLAAADTFRAGAIDQLATHAERIGIRCIKSQRGGDSAAVARDAIDSARARGDDIVIIDTSGRMQNKSNLMEELQKVHSVTQPHLVIFVADALAGNDAVTQAVEFQRRLRFDGAALCKLDTDARGGAALSISHATGRPIILAGTGQGYDDLEVFDPNWLVDQLL